MTGLCASTAKIYVGPTTTHYPPRSYDIHYEPGGGAATAGKCVYVQTLGVSGTAGTAVPEPYISGSGCTGINIRIHDPGGVQRGRTAYVHTSISGGLPTSWSISGTTWTVTYLGTVLNPEAAGCSWTGPHLHQSDSMFPSTYNSAMTTGTTYATGTSSNWLFRYAY